LKIKFILISVIVLISCATKQQVINNAQKAKESRQKVSYFGEMPGSPENTEAIEKALEQARKDESQTYHSFKQRSAMHFLLLQYLEEKSK